MASSAQRQGHKPLSTSWTPMSLRKSSLLALIAVLCMSIIGLELVNWKIKEMDGLRAENNSAVLALRYVPTVIMILVGFAWKGVTSDFCMLMPWAAISGRWAKAKDSILLNYVDALDVVSVYTAACHGHWALSIVIACGFLTGASVALANALSQETIGAGFQTAQNLNTADRFVFNGSLAVPLGWRSFLPRLEWQSYYTEDVENGRYPWTTNTHAFSALDTQAFENDTIFTANVDTFSASLECTPITYRGTYSEAEHNSSFVLEADNFQGCDLPISQRIIWPFNSSSVLQYPASNGSRTFNIPPLSWSNITACNTEDDYRLLATNLVLSIDSNLNSPYVQSGNQTLYNNTNVWTPNTVGISASGFSCSPRYWSIPASIAAASGSELVSTNFVLLTNETKELSGVGVGFDFLQAQLNNPYATSSIDVFQAAATNNETSQHANSYDWSQFSTLKVMQRYSYLYLLSDAAAFGSESTRSLRDPFINTVVRSNQSTLGLVNNATLFEERLNLSFAQFMAALVSTTAREPFETSIAGQVYRPGNFYQIRQNVLRALEAILAVLALVTLNVLVYARPRTYLTRHPGSLDQMTLLVASSPEVDYIFQGISPNHHQMLEDILSDVYCLLSRSEHGALQLKLRRAQDFTDYTADGNERGVELQRLKPFQRDITIAIPDRPASMEASNGENQMHRHRPLALRLGSRLSILSCLAGIIVATAILYSISNHRDGFRAWNSKIPVAFSLVPTIILVLIGYCIASTQQAALTLTTYSHLATNSSRSGRAMLSHQIRDASRLLFEHFATDWSLVSIPCLALVIAFPVLKLMAAKLFYLSVGAAVVAKTFPVDISQIQEINNLSQWVSSSTAIDNAVSIGSFISLQMALSTQVYWHFDRIGSLNLPVMTYNISSLVPGPQSATSDEFTTRIMSTNTSTTCDAADPTDFVLYLTGCNDTAGYKFSFECATDKCKEKYALPLATVDISRTVFPNETSLSGYPFFGYSYPSSLDDSIDIMIANFSGLTDSRLNFSDLKCDGTPLDVSSFGDSMPTITAVNCTRALNLVYANVTFSRIASGTNGVSDDSTSLTNNHDVQIEHFRTTKTAQLFASKQQSAWIPVSYGEDSLEYIRPAILKTTWPAPILVPDGGEVQYHLGNELSPSLYPTSFLSLLTQQQEVRNGNEFALFEPEILVETAAQVYQNWTQGALQFAIGQIYDSRYGKVVPMTAIPAPDLQNLTDSYFKLYRPVIRQDLGFSIALITLIGLAFICVLLVSFLIPRRTLLPIAPSSIAAQISMLVDSRLVGLVRTNSAGPKTLYTENRFGLGWWPSTSSTDAEPGSAVSAGSKMRWGIDIGVLEAENRGLKAREKPRDSTHTGYETVISEQSGQRTARLNTRMDQPAVSTSAYSPLRDLTMDEERLRYRNDFTKPY